MIFNVTTANEISKKGCEFLFGLNFEAAITYCKSVGMNGLFAITNENDQKSLIDFSGQRRPDQAKLITLMEWRLIMELGSTSIQTQRLSTLEQFHNQEVGCAWTSKEEIAWDGGALPIIQHLVPRSFVNMMFYKLTKFSIIYINN